METACGQVFDELDLDIAEEALDVVKDEVAELSYLHVARKDCSAAWIVVVVVECRRFLASSH